MKPPKWKRAMDVALLVATAPAWIPAMLALAAWTQLVSRGPVFFQQARVGLGGRLFVMWKFRSMEEGADQDLHREHWADLVRGGLPMTKLDSCDARLIPGARWVRALGLDELPQLLNVLRGDMSLVGPRPCTPDEFAQFDDDAKSRAGVLPGITGWWQVNGKDRLTFREMIVLDLEYQQKMSPWMDLRILAGTVPAVLAQWKSSRAGRGQGMAPPSSAARFGRTAMARGK